MKDEAVVLDSPSLTVLVVSVDVKQHSTVNIQTFLFVHAWGLLLLTCT